MKRSIMYWNVCVSISVKFVSIMMCMVALLLIQTSCQDDSIDLDNSNVEVKTCVVEQKVQNLIQQVRIGNFEAYKSLALCYRDGDGVEKSYLNMVCMYANYCKRTDGDIKDVVELFEEGHPFRLFVVALNSYSFGKDAKERIEQLRRFAPSEVKAIEAVDGLFSSKNPEIALGIIRDSENEGSELAALFQVVYYEETQRYDDYEQCLIRLAEKYPFLYLKLGEFWMEKYNETDEFSNIQRAMDYYYKADSYGMLTPRYAIILMSMYKHYGKLGLFEYNEKEIERLQKVAGINK